MVRLARISALATSLLLAACATFPPKTAIRANGYDGPTLPASEVATVYILDGRPNYEAGFICRVGDRPVPASGGCASIVYLKPGSHRLQIRYLSRVETGEGEATIAVQAGQLYQLNATSFRVRNAGVISLMPTTPGAKLTFRNVAPSQFSPPVADTPVPYGPTQ